MSQSNDQDQAAPTGQPRGFGEPDTCSACDAIFAPCDMRRTMNTRTGVSTVAAHCTHCDRCFEVKQVLRGGGYVNVSGPTLIADPKRVKAIKASLAGLRGQVQLEALSA